MIPQVTTCDRCGGEKWAPATPDTPNICGPCRRELDKQAKRANTECDGVECEGTA